MHGFVKKKKKIAKERKTHIKHMQWTELAASKVLFVDQTTF